MARMWELRESHYESCYQDQKMPEYDFTDVLNSPNFQDLTKDLLENHEYYALTEGEVYCICNVYFRWNGQKMVEIPDTEITDEIKDDRLDVGSADYAQKFEDDYYEKMDDNMPNFGYDTLEYLPDFQEWVIKTLKFMGYAPSHGDVICATEEGYRNKLKVSVG